MSVPIAAGTLSAISPTDGSQAGGTLVTLTGLGLAETTGVDFGTAPAASFQVVSDTVVTAVAPSGEGTVGVTARSAAGTASVGPQSVFTYLPASVTVTPSSGPESGGTTVAIQGAGLAGATAVDFGTVSAASFKVDSDSEITAVAPPGLGTVDVTVRGPTGWSLLGPSDQYVYTLVTPVVTALAPTVGSAAGGQTVMVTGSGFAPDAEVRFGSRPAVVVSVAVDGTSLKAVVPQGTGTAQVSVTNPLPVTGLRARGSTAYALFADGSVAAWGDGNRGWGYHDIPVQVRATGVTAVAQGWNFGVALQSDGTVAAWGDNCWGELGQGAPGNCQLSPSVANNLESSRVPLPVKGLSAVTAVAAGPQFGLALRSDGTVWAWGRNDGGQLGGGTTNSSGVGTPTEVNGLDDVVAIAAGAGSWGTAYALRSDGTVWAWGQGGSGQLGDGKDANSTTPVQVTGLRGVVGIAAGASVGYALLADGTVWAWGDGSSGGLGNGSTVDSAVPVQVHGLHDVIAIAAGGIQSYGNHAAGYALAADGSVWAWGSMDATDSTPVPVHVAQLPGAVALAANENGDVYVLKGGGSVWAWGPGNGGGELGNGSTKPSSVPVEVSGLRGIVGISAQNDMTLAVRADGTVWAWGGSTWEVLPSGGGGPTPVRVAGLAGVVDLSPGTLAVALKSDGTVWGWTDQAFTYNVFPAYPGQKVLPFPAIAVSAGGGRQVFVASEDGSVWAVAGPDIYQASAKPIRVPFPSTVAIRQLVPTGTWLLGLDSTGHVWEWPWQPSAPAQEVPGLQEVVALAGNNDTAYALRADGTVWSWSQGNGPDLGRGTLQGPVVACDAAGAYCTTLNAGQNAVPGPVLGLTDVRAIAADGNTVYALLADGTVWAWGDNSGGALGDGATPNYQTQQDIQSDTPVQVSGLTDAVAIAAGQSNGEIGYALTSGGQVWHWGGSNPFYAFSYSCYCAAPQAPGNLAGSDVPVPVTGFTRGGLLSAFSAASEFSYESETTVPAVASVAPDTGPAGGGTSVTLTGTGLAVAQAVYFGPTAAPSFTVLSDTELRPSLLRAPAAWMSGSSPRPARAP